MEIINKNQQTITNEDLEKLYEIYYSNTTIEESSFIASKKSHKENWIKDIISNPKLLCSMFYDNNILIGYIIFSLEEKENYVREFEIIKEYQNDGKTFKEMIKKALPYTNINNLYTGRILSFNEDAKKTFKGIGTFLHQGKYVCPYNRLIKFLDMDTRNLNNCIPLKDRKK